MAGLYSIAAGYVTIAEIIGTIYNKGESDVALSSNGNDSNGWVILRSGEKMPFSGQMYAKTLDGQHSVVSVQDFTKPGGGGDSGGTAAFCPIPEAKIRALFEG